MNKIYMDHVATNPLHPEVLDAMLPYFKEHYGNPLSLYEPGIKAREAMEAARTGTAGRFVWWARPRWLQPWISPVRAEGLSRPGSVRCPPKLTAS